MSEIKLIFSIYSDVCFDFKTITKVAGCYPTSFWEKGTPIRKGALVRMESSWNYETSYVIGNDIVPLINLLMSAIKTPEILGQYCDENKLKTKIEFVIKSINNTFPSIVFSKDFIKFCAILDIWIDVDVII